MKVVKAEVEEFVQVQRALVFLRPLVTAQPIYQVNHSFRRRELHFIILLSAEEFDGFLLKIM
jgi:hypothetical protein